MSTLRITPTYCTVRPKSAQKIISGTRQKIISGTGHKILRRTGEPITKESLESYMLLHEKSLLKTPRALRSVAHTCSLIQPSLSNPNTVVCMDRGC